MLSKQQKILLTKALQLGALLVLAFLFALPLVWMVVTSLKPLDETMTSPPKWIPDKIQVSNYSDAVTYGSKELGYIPFLRYAQNSVLLAILCITGSVISNSLVGYAFGCLEWKGKRWLFALTLATMMVPGPILIVPLYKLFRDFGWIGTFRPLWVPTFFGSAFNIFLLRQFFMAIPKELSEAAVLDGASPFGVFLKVIIPLAKPALTVVAVFTFLWSWNDFLGPLLYLTDQRNFTVSLGLQAFQNQHTGTPWNLLMAASLMVIAPVIVVYFVAQKAFVQGISTTGLK
ncbi:UgpE ABC-type sugar transport system, permease component [Fimbriimonadaceae bacterium]